MPKQFISDEDMAKLEGKVSPGFVSDEEMTKLETPEEMGVLESMGRGALDYGAPVAGMLAGGFVGSGLGPAGTAGGAGLGYAAGQEAGALGKHYLFGDELPSTDPYDQATRVAGNVVEGAAGQLAGPAAGAVLSKAGGLMRKATRPITSKVMSVIKDLAGKRAAPVVPPEPNFLLGAVPRAEATVAAPGMASQLLDKAKSAGTSMNQGFSGSAYGKVARHLIPGAQKAADILETAPGMIQGTASLTVDTVEALAPKFGRFAGQLKEAASRSASALATTDFLLQQQEPEYQKMKKDLADSQ